MYDAIMRASTDQIDVEVATVHSLLSKRVQSGGRILEIASGTGQHIVAFATVKDVGACPADKRVVPLSADDHVVTAVAVVGSGVVSVPAVGVPRGERAVTVRMHPASTSQPRKGSLLHVVHSRCA